MSCLCLKKHEESNGSLTFVPSRGL